MAKTKFTLEPSPTFKAAVKIPVPGAGFAPVEFTFKWRDRDGFKELADGMAERAPVDLLLDIACGWELEEPFDADSLTKLTDRYLGAFQAILDAYFGELTKTAHRAGN